jgi:hypothetical protein
MLGWAQSQLRRGLENMRLSRELNHGYVSFEVFTAVTMNNGVFWDITDNGGVKLLRIDCSYKSHAAYLRRRHLLNHGCSNKKVK